MRLTSLSDSTFQFIRSVDDIMMNIDMENEYFEAIYLYIPIETNGKYNSNFKGYSKLIWSSQSIMRLILSRM